MAKNNLQKNFDNFKDYREKIDKSLKDELSLFDRFSENITRRAKGHLQVTLNNLEATESSLKELKIKAKELKDSLFYHDETKVIDRQEIITDTETQVRNENENILEFEYRNIADKVQSSDYLNKALLQSAFDFFDSYKMKYSKNVIDLDDLYKFFSEKNKIFDRTIKKYHDDVLESFIALDNDIKEMDTRISFLIQQKNSKLNRLNGFYETETKAYLDNQLTFSVENNLNSDEIKDLIQDKVDQFSTFKQHVLNQEIKVKKILHQEYLDLYEKVLNKILQRRGNLLVQDPNFFNHVGESITNLKQEIVFAKSQGLASLPDLIKTYNNVIKYKSIYTSSQKRAKNMTKKFLKMKKQIFFEYQKQSRSLIFQMEKYYKLYLDLLKVDPFLAQIIGDNATKIIKDEINYLSTLKINKEHKLNVNFDIKTLQIKQQINDIEAKLIYEVERQIFMQDIDLLSNILDMQTYYIDKQTDIYLSQLELQKEKYNIFRLESAINAFFKHEIKINNINRKYLSLVTELLVDYIRESETHNIHVVEALSEIKLALKEYDINALHFKTLYENEKRFLVIQSNRVSEETKINNEFILTTYENQMRFAKEQIDLAENEFRMRVESIMTAVDEEREYYFNIIENQMTKFNKRKRTIADEYQAKLYHDTFLLEETTDPKFKKQLEKEIKKHKDIYENLVKGIEIELDGNQVIVDAKRRLRELDSHLEDALVDATKLRDDTLEEMQDLFTFSKQKYDYLKEYLSQKVNPLEPNFYNALESSKKRLHYKLKVAEIELDDKTKDLLNNYLNVYFENRPELDKDKVMEKINQMQAEKEIINLEYENEIHGIEDLYENNLLVLQEEKNDLINQSKLLKDNIKIKEETVISQKKYDLESLETLYFQQQNKKQTSFEKEIDTLTKEYNNTLAQSKKYIYDLSSAFEKVLKVYKPYLKITQNNKKIRNIVKRTDKQIKQKEKQELKVLAKTLKKQKLLIKD